MEIPFDYVEPRNRLLQSDLLNGLLFTLENGTSERQVVYKSETRADISFHLWSVLVHPKCRTATSDDILWDTGPDHQYRPKIVRRDYKERQYYRYVRFGLPNGERPLVLRRMFHHLQAEYLELDQEFCLFHNLFEEKKTGAFFDFEAADQVIEVARIAEDEVTVFSDYVNRYLAALKMCLVIFVDSTRRVRIPAHFIDKQERESVKRGKRLRWWRRIIEEQSPEGTVMISRLRAKAVIQPPDITQSGIWPTSVNEVSTDETPDSRSEYPEPRRCPQCGDEDHQIGNGVTDAVRQRYRCRKCNYSYTPNPVQRGYPEEIRQNALILRSSGWSYGRIAKKLKVHRTTVMKWVKTHSGGTEEPVVSAVEHRAA